MAYKNPIQKSAFIGCCGIDIISGFVYSDTYYNEKTNQIEKSPMTVDEAVSRVANSIPTGVSSNHGLTLAVLNHGQVKTHEQALFNAGFKVLIPAFRNSNTDNTLTLYGKIRHKTHTNYRSDKEKENLRKYIFDAKDY